GEVVAVDDRRGGCGCGRSTRVQPRRVVTVLRLSAGMDRSCSRGTRRTLTAGVDEQEGSPDTGMASGTRGGRRRGGPSRVPPVEEGDDVIADPLVRDLIRVVQQ